MSSPLDRDIDVLITPDPSAPHGVRFSMPNGDLTFKNDGNDGFRVFFNIKDPHNTGYRFPDDRREAMWVEEMAPGAPDACPDDYAYWDQFEAKQVMNNNRTLRVRNRNRKETKFGFTLRLTKNPANNGPCIPYDPIGDNKNGNWNILSVGTGTAAAITGAGAGAAITLLTSPAATSESLTTGAIIGGLLGLGALFLFGRGGSAKPAPAG